MEYAHRPSVGPTGFRGLFRTDRDARAVYSEAAGIQRIWPLAVAVPADPSDACTLVRWAQATSTPLVPRGSGTSMAGGAIGPGVIVDLSGFRELRAVDRGRRSVWVGAGALRASVDAAAQAQGLRFPVDPSSGAFCTIGGMASTNAAGAHTLKYGAMRRWVNALDCIFDDGTRSVVRRGVEPPRSVAAVARFLATADAAIRGAPAAALAHIGVRKDSSGYGLADYARTGDLVDLLVGSEGTLALIVGVEVALTTTPGATASVLAAFAGLEAAVEGAAMARQHDASACELLDRTFLEVVRQATEAGGTASGLPVATEAVLLIEIEAGQAADAREAVHALARALDAVGATRVDIALDPATERALWALRDAASPVLARLDPSLKSMQVIEDGAVPPSHLVEYIRGVRDALARRDLRGAIFGHAGDAHIHVNPLVDVRRPGWQDQIENLLADVAALTVRLGGTLTGEHGDGRLRTPLLPEMWPAADGLALRLFRATKAAFDPRNLFNPGVKVATSDASGIGDVKYDTALAPLPHRARQALDRVFAERAYDEPRLQLLDTLAVSQ
jgi:FAD/FMN-containing dehydrogenase